MNSHFENFEDWLDAVRIKLYEETKHMSVAERVAHSNAEGRKIAAKYGITRFKTSPDSPVVHVRHEGESENAAL
jgi:hypothetical protein